MANEKKKEEDKKEAEKQKLIDKGYIKCPKCTEARPLESFIGSKKNTTVNCNICRDKQKISDVKRTKKRDWAKEYRKKLEKNKNKE